LVELVLSGRMTEPAALDAAVRQDGFQRLLHELTR